MRGIMKKCGPEIPTVVGSTTRMDLSTSTGVYKSVFLSLDRFVNTSSPAVLPNRNINIVMGIAAGMMSLQNGLWCT